MMIIFFGHIFLGTHTIQTVANSSGCGTDISLSDENISPCETALGLSLSL